MCPWQVIKESDVRAACNQVLFSMVYHLKSAVLPFASEILKVAVESLRDGAEEVIYYSFGMNN